MPLPQRCFATKNEDEGSGGADPKPDPEPVADPAPTKKDRLSELEAEIAALKKGNAHAKKAGEVAPVSEATMSNLLEEVRGLRADMKGSLTAALEPKEPKGFFDW